MDRQTFENQKEIQAKYAEEAVQEKRLFFQSLLLVSSSTFGILISLHANDSEFLCIRLALLLSEVLFALGILSCVAVLYDCSMLKDRLCQAHHKEVDNAIEQDRDLENIEIRGRKRTPFFEKISIASFVSSVILLCVYAILIVVCQAQR
jgi:hypothetical protein